MIHRVQYLCAILLAALGLLQPETANAKPQFQDFDVGANAEHQTCQARWRFVGTEDPTSVDLYCGAWEQPAGQLVRTKTGALQAIAEFEANCVADVGDTKLVQAAAGLTINQIACGRRNEVGVLHLGLVMEAHGQTVYGLMFPSDWAPALRAARVLLGLDRQVEARSATPGLDEINQVFPPGPPGQCDEHDNPKYHGPPGECADVNYLILRQRAFEYNAIWSFDAAERDFSVLLSLHNKIAPDDLQGRAEILAEIGVNLSASGRGQEAAQSFADAQSLAQQIRDTTLVDKIENYRAQAALDAQDWGTALRLARLANQHRSSIGVGSDAASRIQPAQSNGLSWEAPTAGTQRLLLTNDDQGETDRERILATQAYLIQAVALRHLGRRASAVDAASALKAAHAQLGQTETPMPWLVAMVLDEQAQLDLDQGNADAAATLAINGASQVQALAPESREYAHLLLTLADAQSASGRDAAALESGRKAIKIFAEQPEAPGFPADAGSRQLQRLLSAWSKNHDQAAADEYFQALSLVWDGAAARTAAQLAARLAAPDQNGSAAVRDYQDAERAYTAALARQERLSANPSTDPNALAVAKRDYDQAAHNLTQKEEEVRQKSPRYLELLRPESGGSAVAAKLGPDEGYVRIVLANDQGFGALITHDSVLPYRIDLTAAKAGNEVKRLRNSLRFSRHALRDYDLDDAVALYKALFAPAQERLGKLRVLHIDAGGVLADLPFSAIVVTPPDTATLTNIKRDFDYRGVDWFARHFASDIALGPATFLNVRANSAKTGTPGPVVAFGDFTPDPKGVATRLATAAGLGEQCRANIEQSLLGLGALDETAKEASSDAQIFGPTGRAVVGQAFTDTAFLEDPDVRDAGVIVLATHGVLGLSDCFEEPALLTSLGPRGEGLITASSVLGIPLKARLVILSACDTAGGGRTDVAISGLVDGGEALSGLARSFLYSGTTSILATQWLAAVDASGQQTSAFLKSLKAGAEFAPAVGSAEALLFDDKETSHPFYWASFVLLGDGSAKLQ